MSAICSDLLYFSNRDGRTCIIAADKIVALSENKLPTDTPVRVICLGGLQFDVRGDIDAAQRKLIAALEKP